jgi:hypothetical protein
MHWSIRGTGSRLLLCAALVVPTLAAVSVVTSAPARADSCVSDCDWPASGHIQMSNYPGTNTYTVTFQFTLTSSELSLLQSQAQYLAIKYILGGFNVPANWGGYTITNSNLPGGIHAIDAYNGVGVANPTITRIYTHQLSAGTSYSFTMVWTAPTLSGQTPTITFEWVPAHWGVFYDTDPGVKGKAKYWEPFSCLRGGDFILWSGDPANVSPAWCVFNYNSLAVVLFGTSAFNGGEPNGTLLLGGFRWLDWPSDPAPVVLSSSTTAPSAAPENPTPSSYLNDGTILHGPDGTLYVMAGGAKFRFSSMSEFSSLGYSTSGMVYLDATNVAAIPNVPADGTVLRSGDGNIYVIAGGAKFLFGSWSEFTGQGYTSSSYINVPQAPLDAIGDAPGNMPKNGTVLSAPNGALSVVVGGVTFQFASMTEYHSLGYTDSQIIRVSQAPYNAIPAASTATPPSSGTVLRSGDGNIYVVAGGAKFLFGSTSEYEGQGYPDSDEINVPQAPLDAIGDAPGNMPRNGTAVLGTDGSVYVVGGGVKWYFPTMAEFSGDGYEGFVPVSEAPLNSIPTASSATLPADGTLLKGTGANIYIMQGGQLMTFQSMAQFTSLGYSMNNVVFVPESVLDTLPSGGYLS